MKFIYFLLTLLICIKLEAQNHKRIQFTPSNYYSRFSASTLPVLTIHPGDTIYTIS